MQLFGSDGFRSEFGSNFMTLECLYKFIQALSSWVKYSSLNKPVMIAMDTRSSGLVVRNLFVSVLTYRGIDVLDVGVVPSPGISKLLALNDAALGIMITASHNPWKDNGVKLFSSEGKKFRSEWEANIEERLKSQKFSAEPSKRLGQVFYLRNAFKIYVDSVLLGQRLETGGSKVLIDCANGAFSQLKEAIDGNSRIGFCNFSPNGRNINLNCGALEPNRLLEEIRSTGHDYGIAFDGDGDRAVFVSNKYGLIESEKIACLYYLLLSDRKVKNEIVTTEITNLGFKKNLRMFGGSTVEVEVGDRHVINAVNLRHSLFGFEPSGHFYFPSKSRTMDGLQALLFFLDFLKLRGSELNSILESMETCNRVKKDFSVMGFKRKLNFLALQQRLQNKIDKEQEKLVIRMSMWDPVIRVYYDYRGRNNYRILEKEITASLKALKNDNA